MPALASLTLALPFPLLMSSTKSLIINCGAGHLTASVFSVTSGTLQLERFTHIDLEYDLSQEDQWASAVSEAVKALPSGFKNVGPVSFILPGYQVLTKAIKVPYVEESKQAQAISFEAMQQMPYPLHEVVWDYQILANDGIEIEVVVIAVKRDMIDDFCRRMSQAGLRPARIGAASILDRNTYEITHGADNRDSLLIDIGARTTNLLFVGERGSYIRNISWGGNALTQAIADNLGVPFSQAEKLKVAFYTGQTRLGEEDKNAEALRQNAESFHRRLSQEVTRSIVNYRRQLSAPAPSRIFVTGRGSQLPGIAEALAEAQKTEVERFDPFAAVRIGPKVDQTDLEVFRPSMNSDVGMAAIDLLGSKAYSVNLLPDELVQQMRVSRQKPFFILAAAALALATVPPYLFWSQDSGTSANDATTYTQRAQPLKTLHREITDIQTEAKQTSESIASLEGLVNSRANWIQFFADIQTRLEQVKDVWLEELHLDPSRPGHMAISGRLLLRDYDPNRPDASASAGYVRVDTLLQSLTSSEFVDGVGEQTYDSSLPRILGFKFVLTLNPNKPL